MIVIRMAIIIVCIMGCSIQPKEISSNSELFKIGIAIYNLEDSYMAEMAADLEEKLIKAFENTDTELRYEILDAKGSEAKQSRQMDYLFKQNMDILLLNLVDPASAANVLEQANNQKIAVILFNREPNIEDMDVGNKLWYVGSDGQLAGRLQGEMLMDAWNQEQSRIDQNGNGKIDYILVEGEPAHYDTVRRTNAFIASTEDTLPMNLLANFSADWNRAQAYEAMKLLSGEVVCEIEAAICNNDDMALGIYDFYKKEEYEIPLLIGINDDKEVHELVNQGIFYGTVQLNQKNQVNDIIDIIEKLHMGETVEQKYWYSVPEIHSRF